MAEIEIKKQVDSLCDLRALWSQQVRTEERHQCGGLRRLGEAASDLFVLSEVFSADVLYHPPERCL